MNLFRKCLPRLVSCVAILTFICLAENKQQEAIALIQHSKQLSDIRATNSPPFRMKANVTLYTEKGPTEGTYTEFWTTGIQWRRETAVGDFHRVEVGEGNKRWVLDSSTEVPPQAAEPERVVQVWKLDPDAWKPGTILDRTLERGVVRCVETKPYFGGGKSALCFDKADGTLAAKVVPFQLPERIVDHTCLYREYQKFGDKIFPRLVRCYDDGKPTLELRVVELTIAGNLGAELFARPDGAQETANCQGFTKAPKAVYTPDPAPPRRENPNRPVVLWMKVGQDGKPRDIKVARSIDKAFDSAAIDAVRRWKFEPATCDGKPIESQINVEVAFRVF